MTQQELDVNDEQQPVIPEEQRDEVEHPSEIDPQPRGALVFVGLLIAFYVIYWFITYFEVFILRGA